MRFTAAILMLMTLPVYTPGEVLRTPLQPPPVKEKLREICERGGGRIETENPQVDLTVSCDADQGCYRFLYKGSGEEEWQEIIWYPRFNIDVRVIASVERQPDQDAQLRYLYSVESAIASKQPTHSFAVECSPGSGKIGAPDGEWIARVGNEDRRNSVLRWYCRETPHFGIMPGGREDGFAIDSSALPTLALCWARGDTEEQILADDEPPFEVQILANTGLFENSVQGYTIGPATGTKPASWERMREFLEESKKQHWITEESAQRVAELIAEAEKAEQGRDKQLYRTALQRLLDAVTTLYTPEEENMTSEAYALLFFHTEARLDLIREGEEAP